MDPPAPNPTQESPPPWTKGKESTAQQQRYVVARLLWELKDNGPNAKFHKGVLTAVAVEFHVTHFTIRRVWAFALQNVNYPMIKQFHSSPLSEIIEVDP
jgi:hypothetical protein